MNFLDAAGDKLAPDFDFFQEDTALWRPPLPSDADIQAGAMLWRGETKPIVHDVITNKALNASCSSCHFDDGSDSLLF